MRIDHTQMEFFPKDLDLKIEVKVLFFLVRDRKNLKIISGQLYLENSRISIKQQVCDLLSIFKNSNSSKNDLEIKVVLNDKFINEVQEFINIIREFQIDAKLKKINALDINSLVVNLNTGSIKFGKNKSQKSQITRVLIIEDSKPIQRILVKAYSQIPNVEVVGISSTVEDALFQLKENKPNFISLDMYLEDGTGVDFLKKSKFINFSKTNGARCILVTDASIHDGNLVLEAMASGASSYIKKPQLIDLKDFLKELVDHLHEMFTAPINPKAEIIKKNKSEKVVLDNRDLIIIGSSTGGTEVVKQILTDLPNHFPPVLIVQHMPAHFTQLFAERLTKQTGKHTTEVCGPIKINPDNVYLASGGAHMIVEVGPMGFQVNVQNSEPINRFKPSVSVLFDSVQKVGLAGKSISIMLTGMGRDGAKEMRKLKDSGSLTIGQSEESCVVFGMPRAASEEGALLYSLSPNEISEMLLNLKQLKKAV